MAMKLIKIAQDHYVIVDDSEIKEGDLVFNEYQRQIKKFHAGSGIGFCRKITHSTQPLEWFGGEIILLSEVKELIGEVDVEKKAEKFIGCEYDDIEDSIDQIGYDSFIRGYNQALEDNKDKKWTDEDLRKTWNAAYIDAMSIDEETYKPLFFEDFIQSLQPKTEWEVDFVDGKLALKK